MALQYSNTVRFLKVDLKSPRPSFSIKCVQSYRAGQEARQTWVGPGSRSRRRRREEKKKTKTKKKKKDRGPEVLGKQAS